MATAAVDIVNIALSVHLGARPISSFNDDTKEALLARTGYTDTRDAVLRAHPWNCATKRQSLTANTETPDWGYEYAYQVPTDCLRVLEVNGEDVGASTLWQIEKGEILTDLSPPLEIKFIFRNTEVPTYDPEFVSALSYKLAVEWVEPLIKAANLKQTMFELYKQALSAARGTDGQEGSPRRIQSSTWLDVR